MAITPLYRIKTLSSWTGFTDRANFYKDIRDAKLATKDWCKHVCPTESLQEWRINFNGFDIDNPVEINGHNSFISDGVERTARRLRDGVTHNKRIALDAIEAAIIGEILDAYLD
jgi:hypothetical protein